MESKADASNTIGSKLVQAIKEHRLLHPTGDNSCSLCTGILNTIPYYFGRSQIIKEEMLKTEPLLKVQFKSRKRNARRRYQFD